MPLITPIDFGGKVTREFSVLFTFTPPLNSHHHAHEAARTMEEIRLALLGFGSANRALVRMLLDKSDSTTSSSPSCRCLRVPTSTSTIDVDGPVTSGRLIPWRVVCIVTRGHGQVSVPIRSNPDDSLLLTDGYEIDVYAALQRVESDGMLDDSLVVARDACPKQVSSSSAKHKPSYCRQLKPFNATSQSGSQTTKTQDLLTLLGITKTANIVSEAIPSNPRSGGGEPAISFITAALKAKMHVVSANKGPLAQQVLNKDADDYEEAYWELQRLAAENRVQYLHESAVMDGVPIFSLWKHTLPYAELRGLRGCLNSTTTMILTRMEGRFGDSEGDSEESFQEALDAAKQMGIVEEDESLDVDGYDAAVKLRALLVVLSKNIAVSVPSMDDIPRDSIRDITREDILGAYADGRMKYRLVASAELVDASAYTSKRKMNATTDKMWKARVRLQQLSQSDPLYNLTGTDTSIQFCTDVLGPITMVSTDPNLVDTAYGLFSDIIRVAGGR
jgi:homoserine dehydrogenase